jgi:hypothetical protein
VASRGSFKKILPISNSMIVVPQVIALFSKYSDIYEWIEHLGVDGFHFNSLFFFP